MVRTARLAPPGLVGLVALLAACSGPSGDPHSTPQPDPLGPGLRIRQVADPNAPTHPKSGQSVKVTAASFLFVDTFDETHNGKSRGTIYLQDVGSQEPYSGISIFQPAFTPADFRAAPGDVLDFLGPYTELGSVGTAIFPAGQMLIQLSKPLGTFRYEYTVPAPRVIDPTDLNDFTKGRPWTSMLVTAQNVTLGQLADDGKGRVTGTITADVTTNGVRISNEFYDLKIADYPAGTTFKSVTGIVTWFYSYHIAPRSAADLVQ